MTGAPVERTLAVVLAQPLHAEVDGLRAALDEVADALEHGHVDTLVASAPRLGAAVVAVQSCAKQLPPEVDRNGLLVELRRASVALVRCERLGDNLAEIVRLSASARGFNQEYDRDGGERPLASLRAFDMRA